MMVLARKQSVVTTTQWQRHTCLPALAMVLIVAIDPSLQKQLSSGAWSLWAQGCGRL